MKLINNQSCLKSLKMEMEMENVFPRQVGGLFLQTIAMFELLQVDLMKRNPEVGASCGRIHPTGSGYMQWYQVRSIEDLMTLIFV
jgi:hypothetical protein